MLWDTPRHGFGVVSSSSEVAHRASGTGSGQMGPDRDKHKEIEMLDNRTRTWIEGAILATWLLTLVAGVFPSWWGWFGVLFLPVIAQLWICVLLARSAGFLEGGDQAQGFALARRRRMIPELL